ncbi:MAG: S-layer homology domain-containing protein, partial [Clostridia bacterium]|nr:S-layer homology domain-containing protein [Clostridia bacterium]
MNNHIKRVIAAALCLILAIPAFTVASSAEGDLPFIDVKKSEWYYDPVLYVYENGIMKGMSGKTFEPETSVTRAMFVTMLGRLWGVEQKVTNAFKDVSVATGDWYAGYVGWASE